MKAKVIFTAWMLAVLSPLQAQQPEEHYIEVTGTSEIEIVPDKIHYIIEIKEYFEEEFDGKSKPEEYRTKVPLEQIEKALRQTLRSIGIPSNAIRTQEIGNNWRRDRQTFLVSKQLNLTLKDFQQIEEIVRQIDSKGVSHMYIGELENKDISTYHRQGRIEALQAARNKAAYLVEALGKGLGNVLRIVEKQDDPAVFGWQSPQSNISVSKAGSFDQYRTIKKRYSMQVRFEITDRF